MTNFFTGRSNRQEYWISVALLIVATGFLRYFHMDAASIALFIMWIITWSRRLHDIGKPAWLSAIPVVLMIGIPVVGLLIAGPSFLNEIESVEQTNSLAGVSNKDVLVITISVATVIAQFGFTIWLGVKKGDTGDNKFGAPPKD